MNAVGYLAILAVAILGIQVLDNALTRTVGISMLVLFAILFAFISNTEAVPWKLNLHLGVMTAIVVVLMALNPGWSVFPMLFLSSVQQR